MIKNIFLLIFLSLNSIVFAQQTAVDFQKLKGKISLHPEEKTVEGKLSYTFQILEKTDSIFLDGKNMKVKLSENSSLQADLKSTDDKIWIFHDFKPEKTY